MDKYLFNKKREAVKFAYELADNMEGCLVWNTIVGSDFTGLDDDAFENAHMNVTTGETSAIKVLNEDDETVALVLFNDDDLYYLRMSEGSRGFDKFVATERDIEVGGSEDPTPEMGFETYEEAEATRNELQAYCDYEGYNVEISIC